MKFGALAMVNMIIYCAKVLLSICFEIQGTYFLAKDT
jgi:hypothetical protein